MAALGHADPRLTLRVHTHLMRRGTDERQRLATLVEGTGHLPAAEPVLAA
jgi:hypothetical protein